MSAHSPPPDGLPGPVDRRRTVRFREVLGKGGFGAVYLADLVSPDDFVQRVAIKVLSAEMIEVADFAARQRDEARLLGRIVHENVVRVMDLTEIDGRPAVIMEYVDGIDLAQLLARGPLSPRACFQVAARVAGALQAVRTTPDPQSGLPLDVVHRDIKPANVLLTPDGGVKVLDFGIARADFAREGKTGSLQFGTTRYMAPEQWLYGAVSHKVDIFALGITLAEALAGRPVERAPLDVGRYEDHMRAVVDQVTSAEWTATARTEARELLGAMLAFEPRDRPGASAVADGCLRLADAIQGESLTRVARRRVPALVEHRRSRLASLPLPHSAELDQPAVHVGRALPTLPTVQESVVSLPAPHTPAPAPRPVFVGRAHPDAPTALRSAPTDAPSGLPRGRRTAVLVAAATIVAALVWAATRGTRPALIPPGSSPPRPVERTTSTTVSQPAAEPAGGADGSAQPSSAAPGPAEGSAPAGEPEADARPRRSSPAAARPEAAAGQRAASASQGAPPTEAAAPNAERPGSAAEGPPAGGASTRSRSAAPARSDASPAGVDGPAEGASRTPGAPAPSPSPRHGPSLPVTLTSTPYGASVYVDGQRIPGTTPLHAHALPTGRHDLRMIGEAGECRGTIRVSSARTNTFVCDLAGGVISARQ